MINMEIVKYKPEYKNDFIRLSKNWITKYFALESDDFEVFENIDKLIKNGAMIYFAIENGVVYATCMAQPCLLYTSNGVRTARLNLWSRHINFL